MMTVKIDVNGNQLHCVDVVNTGSFTRQGEVRYAVKADGESLGTVVHRPADGALFLGLKAMALASEHHRKSGDVHG